MNSLRATSTLRSCSCISLKVSRELAELVLEVTGSGSMKRPRGHMARGPLEPPDAPREPRRHEVAAEQRDQRAPRRVASSTRSRTNATVSAHVLEVARVERDPRQLPALAQRLGDHPDLLAAEGAVRRACCGACRARAAASASLNGTALLVRVVDGVEAGIARRRLQSTLPVPARVTCASVASADRADARGRSSCGRRRCRPRAAPPAPAARPSPRPGGRRAAAPSGSARAAAPRRTRSPRTPPR